MFIHITFSQRRGAGGVSAASREMRRPSGLIRPSRFSGETKHVQSHAYSDRLTRWNRLTIVCERRAFRSTWSVGQPEELRAAGGGGAQVLTLRKGPRLASLSRLRSRTMRRLALAVRPLPSARLACARLRSSTACLSTDSSNQNGAALSFLEKARRAARERASLRMSSDQAEGQASDELPTVDDARPPPLSAPAQAAAAAAAAAAGARGSAGSVPKKLVELSPSEQQAKLIGIDMAPNAGLPDGLTDDAILTFLLETWDAPKTGPPRRKLYKLQRSLDVADVWPLKSTAFDERLQEKEILLSAVHRAAMVREIPVFKKGDPDQGGRCMRALASLRALSVGELRQGQPFTSGNGRTKQLRRPGGNGGGRPNDGGQRGGQRGGHQGGGSGGYWEGGRLVTGGSDSGTDHDRYGSAWDDEDSRSAGR